MYLTIEIGKGFSHIDILHAVKTALTDAVFIAGELFPEAETITVTTQPTGNIVKAVEDKVAENEATEKTVEEKKMSDNFLPPEPGNATEAAEQGTESMQVPRDPGNILNIFKINSERGDTSTIGRNTADNVREQLRGLFKLSTKDNKALKDKKNEKAGRILEFLVPGIQDLEDLTVVQAAWIMEWCKTESKGGRYLAAEQAIQEAELIIKQMDTVKIVADETEKKTGPTPGTKPGPAKKAGPKPASAYPKAVDGAFVCAGPTAPNGELMLFMSTTRKELAETYPDIEFKPATIEDVDDTTLYNIGCFNAIDSDGNPVCFTAKTTAAGIESEWPGQYTEITPATHEDVARVG